MILVILADLLVGVGEGVLVIILIVGQEDRGLGHVLEHAGGDQAAVHGLNIILIGIAGLLGRGLYGVYKLVILGLHMVGPGVVFLIGGGPERLGGLKVGLGLIQQILAPGEGALVGNAQKSLGRVGQGLAAEGLAGVQAHVADIAGGADIVVSGVVGILHLSGGILGLADGEGGLAALEGRRVPNQDEGGHQHKGYGHGNVEDIGLALLGLLLGGADGLGVNGAAGGKGLAVFLFSGCTHGWFIPLV